MKPLKGNIYSCTFENMGMSKPSFWKENNGTGHGPTVYDGIESPVHLLMDEVFLKLWGESVEMVRKC